MVNIKRKFCIIILLISLFLPASVWALSGSATVNVQIPKYKVTLNGMQIDNVKRQYPLITYQDITYVPMTYLDSRFLNLTTEWSQRDGLSIDKQVESAQWQPDESVMQGKNKAAYTAETAGFPIKVNGQVIDNKKEPYPLLVFRNITYFPLTWRFAMDEFGWESYTFNSLDGLVINSHALPVYENARQSMTQNMLDHVNNITNGAIKN